MLYHIYIFRASLRHCPNTGRNWPTHLGFRSTLYFKPLVWFQKQKFNLSFRSVLTKAKGSDLNRIIPVRFYGDGCEAQRHLVFHFFKCFKICCHATFIKMHLSNQIIVNIHVLWLTKTKGNKSSSSWAWSAQLRPNPPRWTLAFCIFAAVGNDMARTSWHIGCVWGSPLWIQHMLKGVLVIFYWNMFPGASMHWASWLNLQHMDFLQFSFLQVMATILLMTPLGESSQLTFNQNCGRSQGHQSCRGIWLC